MKKINYFDLGMFDGKEIDMFITEVSSDYDYNVYGFEAHPKYHQKIKDRFKDNGRIQCFNYAITDKANSNQKLKLYMEPTGHGNSIFSTKNNIDINNCVEVNSISFVNWVKENIPDYKNCYNILRFNIEGAELFLINDIIENDFNKHINLYLGSVPGEDILKVSELQPYYNDYIQTLKNNKIDILPYCNGLNNISIKSILKQQL